MITPATPQFGLGQHATTYNWPKIDHLHDTHAEEMSQKMEKIWDEVRASIEFHKGKVEAPKKDFKVGDKVWLVTTYIQTKRPTKKLDNKKAGPFTIVEKISSHAYRLELPATMRIHNVFHINLLSAFKEDTDFHRRQVKPAPIITDEGEEEYEVDKIVAWREDKDGLRHQIRWKGYDELEDTMERAEKIAELPEVMQVFKKEFPEGPLPAILKRKKKKKKKGTGRLAYTSMSHSNKYAPLQVP
ncbi:hypothetical protein BN14_10033 [Rhizoctonia solani AG-1 IB]|uniref:Chromo domain-containing protein n=1 Tax=Thanatephorus cucumeris (strain AG1-IB / isolate 7/3/14) TaxID=1108050 RepID=M5CGD2_THACB|nr:hypothetical protein BN14_10033 [Rhizoctonia solani AG-1 IB]